VTTKPQRRRPATHGGARAGAGRRPDDPAGKKTGFKIYLTPTEISHCTDRSGSAPAHLRRLLAADMSQQQGE
jgi:hypothetical protein